MDAKKQSNSFTAQLFGSKESESSSSSSSGLFNSIFPLPSKSHGKNYINFEVTKKNHDPDPDPAAKRDSMDKEDMSRNRKTDMSPFYQQKGSQPCHLSSSIYYGGQDIYPNPHITKNTPEHSTYNKDEENDGLASRGNWWQGSLYY